MPQTFKKRSPFQLPPSIVPLEEQVDEVLKLIKERAVLYIEGKPYLGKTSFLKQIGQRLEWDGKKVYFLEGHAALDRDACLQTIRAEMAVPDDSFSVTYLMDWNHPAIGKCWQTWTPDQSLEEIIDPRTFGSMQEHQLLGIADEVVSLTADGFTQPLRWPNEPVRHKLLDVVGDLALAGVNPLSWKARFISIKGGHEMDVDMAKRLAAFVQ